MRKILIFANILLISFILCSTVSFAANSSMASSGSTGAYAKVGMSGGQFLKIGHGARGAAMAGAVSAITNDLSSIYWNPAGLAEIPSLTAAFDYTSWFAGFNHNFAALGVPLGDNFAFAVHYTGLTSAEMERTTIERPNGTNQFFTASDISVGLSVAGFLTDQFSFGLTTRFLNNVMADASASGLAFDVGTKYRTGVQGIVLGVSLHGLTTQLTYSGNEFNRVWRQSEALWKSPDDVALIPSPFDIPLLFRANVAADVYKSPETVTSSLATGDIPVHYVVAALDFITTSDSPEQFALGAEYIWNNLLSFRAGYRMGHDIQGFSGGLGFKYFTGSFSGRLDYAISPLMRDMGLVNRISITIDLGQ